VARGAFSGHSKVFYLEQDRATSGVRQVANGKTPGYAAMAERRLQTRHFEASVPGFSVLVVPSGVCGVAVKALPHCPRLQGLLSSRVQHNVGLGLRAEWPFAISDCSLLTVHC
jgi:hypothetical protein